MGSTFLAGEAAIQAELGALNQKAYYHVSLINTIGKTQ